MYYRTIWYIWFFLCLVIKYFLKQKNPILHNSVNAYPNWVVWKSCDLFLNVQELDIILYAWHYLPFTKRRCMHSCPASGSGPNWKQVDGIGWYQWGNGDRVELHIFLHYAMNRSEDVYVVEKCVTTGLLRDPHFIYV